MNQRIKQARESNTGCLELIAMAFPLSKSNFTVSLIIISCQYSKTIPSYSFYLRLSNQPDLITLQTRFIVLHCSGGGFPTQRASHRLKDDECDAVLDFDNTSTSESNAADGAFCSYDTQEAGFGKYFFEHNLWANVLKHRVFGDIHHR